MIHLSAQILEMIAVALALCSLGYYGVCWWSASKYLQAQESEKQSPKPEFVPPVSLLKPLRGLSPGLYECLRSHCQQDYPEYEIIFGVSDPDDPAVELVRRLQSLFPERPIRLTICRERLGANVKVSNLAQMLPEAIYDHLLVDDGDIFVEPDYLRRVVAPLNDAGVGLVTCLYRGVAPHTLGSRLEALGIGTDFAAGVLVARQLEGIQFGLGSTLVFRRRDLKSIGGFEAIVDYLADDYEVGNRLGGQGLEVRLSDVVVETFLPPYTTREFVDHQLRWARTIRDVRPWGYVGTVCTFGIPWAVLGLIGAGGAGWAWILLGTVAVTRVAAALKVGNGVLGDRHLTSSLWLLPLRDFVGLLVWMASFAGHTVVWRGDSFALKKGRLVRLSS